jgi:hypothetical protein
MVSRIPVTIRFLKGATEEPRHHDERDLLLEDHRSGMHPQHPTTLDPDLLATADAAARWKSLAATWLDLLHLWLQRVRFGVNLFLLLCLVLDIGRFRVDPILF